MDNDIRTPRERIDEEFMRRMMEIDSDGEPNLNNFERQSSPQNENALPQNGADCTLAGRPLAMVYSPCQSFRDLFDVETGFVEGTIFKELSMPFTGKRENSGGGRL